MRNENINLPQNSQSSKTRVKGSVCNHLNAKYVEVIQGFQQKIFDENGYYANLESGNRISTYVECYNCGEIVNITPKAKLPQWVKNMIETLEVNDFANSGSRL